MAVQKNRTPTRIKQKPPAQVQPEEYVLKRPLLLLGLATLILYIPTFSFGFTDLDDGILINQFEDYNQNLGNIITSFGRSILNTSTDIYYRPITLDSMLLNYQLCGQNIMGYHIVNVLLHIAAVLLLYKLFLRLGTPDLHAFILSFIFAVHPVLTEAVAWVPGRIDVILAIFTFSFFISSINYSETGKISHLLLSVLFLLLAFFTKETAVFLPPAAFVILVVVLHKDFKNRNNLVQYPLWAACFALWFVIRRVLHIPFGGAGTMGMVIEFVHKLPTIIQYLGKIMLPFNLSVYPLQKDTTYFFGIAALAGLTIMLYYTYKNAPEGKKPATGTIVGGTLLFLFFTLPTLMVPNKISIETYEYRLYLPLFGILLVVSQLIVFLKGKELLISGLLAGGILAILNFTYQKNFTDPLNFWVQAVKTSPHSAHANMMLAARVGDPATTDTLFLRAFKLDPNEKYLNYIYAVMLQNKDSVLASEKYLLAEKKITNYQEVDFLLAHVALEKKDYPGAIGYLKAYLEKVPKNKIANDNLLLLYLDTDQDAQAKAQALHMKQMGMDVDKKVLEALGI